ncbi:MAG: hypothetical protein BKP49_04085 [Treponema sp. CETP13]|nr:MAG: hypothetical protein BKP49_04085 [Treponema sp. CETP13]
MGKKELSEEELTERIAILTRLRTLLVQQRQKFRDYLEVLEKQADTLEQKEAPNSEELLAHSQLEQEIVGNIKNLQKVITPIEAMSHETNSTDIPELKADLTKLQNQVLEQNNKNRELLKSHIVTIRTQIKGFKNPYKNKKSVYSKSEQTAKRISVEC